MVNGAAPESGRRLTETMTRNCRGRPAGRPLAVRPAAVVPLLVSFAAALLLLSVHTAGRTADRAARPPAGRDPVVRVEKNLEAQMRDAVILRADVYRPDAPGRFPALLQRTPYSKNPGGDGATFRQLAAHGFVVVVQDTRGRYMSDGVARPHDEAEDGYDTVEWVATLPYVDGRIGMFGGSYSATTQLLAAPLRPPHLTALFPSASYASRYDMVFQGGAFYLADGLAWNLGQAADVRRRTLTPEADRDTAIGLTDRQRVWLRERWLWHVPLKTMDALELQRYAPAYF
jgi:predicted acyl esterase